jgi:hypothetical protein
MAIDMDIVNAAMVRHRSPEEAAGDERVAEVLSAARGEVLRIVPVGGYPRPLPPDDAAAGRC